VELLPDPRLQDSPFGQVAPKNLEIENIPKSPFQRRSKPSQTTGPKDLHTVVNKMKGVMSMMKIGGALGGKGSKAANSSLEIEP